MAVKLCVVCVQSCLVLNSGKFEIFCILMTGKVSLLQFFEANNVFGH